MALIVCEECGRSVSDKAVACVGCGAPIVNRPPKASAAYVASSEKPRKKKSAGTAILLAFLFGPLGLFYCAPIAAVILTLFGLFAVIVSGPLALGVWIVSMVIAGVSC